MSEIAVKQKQFTTLFSDWLESYLEQAAKNSYRSDILLQSQKYSLMSDGKRFRPFLSFLVFDLFSKEHQHIRTLCLAIEMVHTYSLIHDDLPCMDNDDFRRGKPSNHKAFSEDVALLAGDGLLTDVFYLLASDHLLTHEKRTRLISMLSMQIGSFGMVSGQTQDMKADRNISFEQLKTIHNLKTANLIEAAAVGAGIVAGVTDELLTHLNEFSHCLGMAFQIKDDILDANEKDEDFKNFVSMIGMSKTQSELENYSKRAAAALEKIKYMGHQVAVLQELIDSNIERTA